MNIDELNSGMSQPTQRKIELWLSIRPSLRADADSATRFRVLDFWEMVGMAGMVDRYRAELMPNGLVRLFDHHTLFETLFETCGYGDGGRRVITVRSGPEVTDKAGWDAAYAAFPSPV